MGQARNKQLSAFALEQIEGWEADDCVDFAVALARITGWLLHVDWWSTSRTPTNDQIRPLRVYVADNNDLIFDARGIRSIFEFNERIVANLARQIATGQGGILTRFYDEAGLASVPLRSQPNEEKIAIAMEAIRANPHFLKAIPARTPPLIPAHEAAKFTFGRCAPFAEALHELSGLPPVAMLAVRFSPRFEGTERSESGYFHSVVLHPDGAAEDTWGKSSLKEIAARFGVLEVKTSRDEHVRVVEKLRQNSADHYESALTHARDLIRIHRLQ